MRVQPRSGRRVGRNLSLAGVTVILLLEGVGGLLGGVQMLGDPFGSPMGMSIEMLAGTPFGSYLIPGLLLTLVLGVYPLLAALLLWWRPAWRAMAPLERLTGCHWSWCVAVTAGLAMIVWIGVQVAMLGPVHFLQAVVAGMGLVVVAVAFTPVMRRSYQRAPELVVRRKQG